MISTLNSSYAMQVNEDGFLINLHWGGTLSRLEDLPEPEGPVRAIVSPACTLSEIPRRISTGPALPFSDKEASLRDRIGSVMGLHS